MYRTLMRPVLRYASETWVLSKADERSLGLFERRILRCIFGAVHGKGTCRKMYNHELCKLFNELDVTRYIQINRLSWAGPIILMQNIRTVKKVFDTRHEGTKNIGRPKLRWEDGVIQDIRAPGAKNLGIVAMNREDWLKLPKKATIHTGLSNQWS
jgi:hypothetical protein